MLVPAWQTGIMNTFRYTDFADHEFSTKRLSRIIYTHTTVIVAFSFYLLG